jgi:hypothetical protein
LCAATFRAFAAYWAVPATAATAKEGTWIVGPGVSFFNGIEKALGGAPIVVGLYELNPVVTHSLEAPDFNP